MIIVTNPIEKPVVCGAIKFAPGETQFKNADLSQAKLAQISSHPRLKWVKVQDKPVDKKGAK
ncbi:hypothetical protein [uncultured Paraglaciecola sp.]|uniref:hypothetical protein n=1 Tax=uncultured Paraglaciecola sp. TaxID=1765024 RepID=UPI0026072C97|nr:hypothetical protein [uncultured Paraglaciecola sp.]